MSSNSEAIDDAKTLHPVTSRHREPIDYIGQEGIGELTRIATKESLKKSEVGKPARRLASVTRDDDSLNPQSPSFDLRKWLNAAMNEGARSGERDHNMGILFRNLNIFGSGAALQYQETVTSLLIAPIRLVQMIFESRSPRRHILHNFDGVLKRGELLLVLGRPGSGCSTFLKSLCGEVHGLDVAKDSVIHYNGIPQKRIIKEFKGEVVYNQEVDRHFPRLTVGQTLEFAAATRTPHQRFEGMSRSEYAKHMAQVIMAVFGLSHTYNTNVGDDFIRGVSGGERKRVSIAEMALSGAPVAAWDNSTRGLDSATALKFVESLRLLADITGSTHAVAAYQASQNIYDTFDKVILLYEGRQIYYGSIEAAKPYFERQGWYCPPRQTTGDYLTSLTNPQERLVKTGMEDRVPRTAEEFEQAWRSSREYELLQEEMAEYERQYPVGVDTNAFAEFQQQKRGNQAKNTRAKSPYLISVPMQIKLNTVRAYQRLYNDSVATVSTVVSNIILALIIGSCFYMSPNTPEGFQSKGATLFFAVLLNALTAMSEINNLYAQRPIVEKQNSYAFYHPSTEAIASVLSDIPVKFALAVAFNIILYFLAGLNVRAGSFFLYFLITFVIMFVMSAVFRTLAAVTQTISQAMGFSGVMILALVVYTGFVLPVPSMHPWFEWIHYLNPIYYAFEVLVANEFHGRSFPCPQNQIVPFYADMNGTNFVCSMSGGMAGEPFISGDRYMQLNFQYTYDHVWRNFGILIGFLVGFMAIYFAACEINSSTTSSAETLVFRRGHAPPKIRPNQTKETVPDEEAGGDEKTPVAAAGEADSEEEELTAIKPQTDIFTWRDVTYDIEVKEGTRRLLDNVSGWVKPGTLTALMGVSGAGKTTLLDVLAHRTSMGVVTGSMFVNGKGLDAGFQRKTGYVQQQDLHLGTATVRESLRFSALLRQPKTYSIKEKYDYVEDVIRMLKMEDFAEAIVGVPGEGLNVEQRKLLTIGVELAARPKLLLFLDEPTRYVLFLFFLAFVANFDSSGLDSQSSWAICAFLRKLAKHGQAILCTIHQPSAILFQQFDQLLFLARGGKTVYYGPIGENSRTLLNYFESHGARVCGDQENPAEYMLDVVNLGRNPQGEDWFDVWKQSPEFKATQEEIDRIHAERGGKVEETSAEDEAINKSEFAMPFWFQLYVVTYRVFQQYWRMPAYIFSKWGLGIAAGLFIGFSFYQAKTSLQGMQTIVYSIFMLCTIFTSLVQQLMPLFVEQRALYEVRERPSKAYSWKAFLIASVVVEVPYMIITGIIIYACYFYAVVGIPSSVDQGIVLLYCIQFFIYASTFGHMCIAALPDAQTASAIVILLFAMSLTFCGVMQPPNKLPGFWIFMYRVSPFTYWTGGMAASQVHGRKVHCSSQETVSLDPPSGQTCGSYLGKYASAAGGQILNPESQVNCQYCSMRVADQFLGASWIYYSDRWRNFGIVWAFIAFNVFMATFLYYAFRVKKWSLGDFLPKKVKK